MNKWTDQNGQQSESDGVDDAADGRVSDDDVVVESLIQKLENVQLDGALAQVSETTKVLEMKSLNFFFFEIDFE